MKHKLQIIIKYVYTCMILPYYLCKSGLMVIHFRLLHEMDRMDVLSKEELDQILSERSNNSVGAVLCDSKDDLKTVTDLLKDIGSSFEVYCPFGEYCHDDDVLLDFLDNVESEGKGELILSSWLITIFRSSGHHVIHISQDES